MVIPAIWPLARCAVAVFVVALAPAQDQGVVRTEGSMGTLTPLLRAIQKQTDFRLDYRHRGRLALDEWRRQGREEIARALSYAPKAVALDLRVHSTATHPGYELRRISFAGSALYRIPAFLLVPTQGKGRYPGVVALHDHGGYFVHGKEKLVPVADEHPALTAFKKQAYGGRSYAAELARRGFVVLVIDAFYWGERRLQFEQTPEDLRAALANLNPAQPEYVTAMNRYLRERVNELNSTLALCGATWLGIMNYDDRRSVDLLASLPEVDPGRLGCVGLSIGGYRATYLTGTDPRIKASVVVGWMTALATTLDLSYNVVAGLPDAAPLHASLDHPDVASLAAPDCAILVQNCGRDRLFTRAGMEQAAEKLRLVYAGLKRPERFKSEFYDVPHQFNVQMQEAAFEWLGKWLSAGGSAR
jgi:dienelactone hydrolase